MIGSMMIASTNSRSSEPAPPPWAVNPPSPSSRSATWATSPASSDAAIVTRMVRTSPTPIRCPPAGQQGAPQQEVADDRAGQESEPVGQPEVAGDQLGIAGEVRGQHRADDLDGRDDEDDHDRRPRLLARVEHAQLQQHQPVGDQRERRQRDRGAQVAGVDLAEVAVGEQCAAHRRPADGHERHDRDQRDQGQPGGQRQVGRAPPGCRRRRRCGSAAASPRSAPSRRSCRTAASAPARCSCRSPGPEAAAVLAIWLPTTRPSWLIST